jgi:aerobic-type carbon monoxide dehydrogenase small subunit (CoxS/CutS family)
METYDLNINGKSYQVEATADTPLLWVIRDLLGLTGTKYSCGIGQCGSCTVHIDGKAARSCITPVSSIGEGVITTIEGLSKNEDHPLQKSWQAEKVVQCGYCQPGQIMSAAALLNENPDPSDEDIDRAMKNVLCRCGTYQRIRKAIHLAAEEVGK